MTAKRSPSGEHEAVKSYRAKLESIEGETVESVDALNRELAAYLEEIRTPIPPPQPPAEDRPSQA